MQWPSYLYLLSYKYCKLQFYDQNICLVKVLIPHNTEYNIALCCSVIIGSYIWGEGWGGGWKRNACRVLLWNQEGNSYLEDWGVDGRIILKWILYIYIYMCVCVCARACVRADSFGWEYGQLAGCCEYRHVTLISIQCWEFTDLLRSC